MLPSRSDRSPVPDGGPVGDTYIAQGVSFVDASFAVVSGLPGASDGLGINDPDDGAFQKPNSPIVAIFTDPQNSVSITALDVGNNGVEIDAYDAAVGGKPHRLQSSVRRR